MNTKGAIRMNTTKNKIEYIGVLRQCLQAKEDFSDLIYCRDYKGNEYLIMYDIVGQIAMFNITGYTEERILQTVAKAICGIVPSNLVTERQKRLEIARLYRRTA